MLVAGHQYDWNNLGLGWSYHGHPWPQLYSLRLNMYFPLAEVVVLTDPSTSSNPHPGYFEAKTQLTKCRVDLARHRHEATHGWRNPPCIYEDRCVASVQPSTVDFDDAMNRERAKFELEQKLWEVLK